MSVKVATTRFTIDRSHPALAGHFPGNPIVPGVVVLDEVVAAALAASTRPLSLLSVPQVKFMALLLPGVEAEFSLETNAATVRFAVTADGATIAQGTLELGERT